MSTKRKNSESEENGNVQKKIKIDEKEAGTLLFSGLFDYDERNNKDTAPYVKWSPIRFKSLENVRIKDVSSGPVSYFTYAISENGKVYSWGNNQKGQLGFGDCKNRQNPTLVEELSDYNIVAVATGRHHGLLLTDDGVVFACGDNKSGQCGIGQKREVISSPTKIDYSGSAIVQVACGGEYSMILNEDGEIYSFGLPEYGQLGNGSTNMEIIGRKEVFHCTYSPTQVTSFLEVDVDSNEKAVLHPRISFIACGINHSVAIDTEQRLFTWGFGGYGRLGHNCTSDEYFPRLMNRWYRITGRADGGIVNIACGGQFNMVNTIVPKCTYMFGQLCLTKEANMYPKFVDDLSGWQVRHISCSQSGFLVCADDSVIGCQPGKSNGTLALGDKIKSSAAPKLITTLKDLFVLRTGLGYMHACFIARNSSEKDKTHLEKFPLEEFDDNKPKSSANGTKKKGAKTTKKKGKK